MTSQQRRSEPMITEITGAYRILILLRPMVVALLLFQLGLAVAVGLIATQVHDNTVTEQTLQRAQALQQQQSAQFVRDFLAEQNYVCRVVARVANQFHIEVPPPSGGVCDVTVKP